ncbi:glycerol dehydrogenase-like iron-containing ADH family enzyme [Pseudorhizobium tarimense]|uniref:Glycerol dehydrogenase-like iron-containing ADH family enzyme n=1 Tax=Pseudorhizobium tarimense TaxID=1079109 RepID=A0ABV2H5L0_9HYPH|nr:hypothetical protein [Pseudorhizobium tarimense]MCJ8519037.1 hypothetical protein [Pseudorhizobium tarimense]
MEQLANLPPPALITFGAVLAVIFAVRYLGILSGQKATPAASSNAAQVAAVIVDPTALNRATDALQAHTEATKRLTDAVVETGRHMNTLGIEADRIREELRIQREIRRDR